VFVAATLYSDAGPVPVHIRNMSPTGALFESSACPETGAAVILKRGGLQIAGRIAWKTERKGGVAFSSSICVADWMSRQVGAGQERVDQIVSEFKADRPLEQIAADRNVTSGDHSIAEELRALRAELGQLGNSLISDVILVATHPEIQTIDISLQRVDRIIAQLRDQQSN
jgi:hypothetical protein